MKCVKSMHSFCFFFHIVYIFFDAGHAHIYLACTPLVYVLQKLNRYKPYTTTIINIL